jgi:anti-sigma regulatory factor (Ser/Thr protein kinase)
MVDPFAQSFSIKGSDFINAGKASMEVKSILKQLAIDPTVIRRVAIAAYEAEMNVVMYAQRAAMTLEVTPQVITISVDDEGPGIPDINLAMQEGYSTASAEMREMGFGAGMGLPNIQRNADEFEIDSVVGKGTRLNISFLIN